MKSQTRPTKVLNSPSQSSFNHDTSPSTKQNKSLSNGTLPETSSPSAAVLRLRQFASKHRSGSSSSSMSSHQSPRQPIQSSHITSTESPISLTLNKSMVAHERLAKFGPRVVSPKSTWVDGRGNASERPKLSTLKESSEKTARKFTSIYNLRAPMDVQDKEDEEEEDVFWESRWKHPKSAQTTNTHSTRMYFSDVAGK